MTATVDTTVGDIVAADFRAAAVFDRYGIDFCCGGGASLTEACRGKGVSASDVLAAIASACAAPDSGTPRFSSWDLPTLIAYIVSNHHAYVRGALPSIQAHAQKLAAVHGGNHPELLDVSTLFGGVVEEMTSHMAKEEQVLFPFIAAMSAAVKAGAPSPAAPFGRVSNPIRMMEREHESAGSAMAAIRDLTEGYAVPADGCATYRICMQELEAFEADLHAHVHLENNILFPKAKQLAGEQ